MASKELKQKLAEVLEKSWNEKEFCEFFMDNYKSELIELVNTELRDNGYPTTANYINTDFTLFCDNNLDFEEWSEIALERYISEDTEEAVKQFLSGNDDYYMYADNRKNLNLYIKFTLSLEEYLQQHPTIETLTKVISQNWEKTQQEVSQIISEDLFDYDDIVERFNDALSEAGYVDLHNVDYTKIEFTLTMENKMAFEQWSEIALERYVYSSIDRFVGNEMLLMFITEYELLEPVINIDTDVEDYNEMNS